MVASAAQDEQEVRDQLRAEGLLAASVEGLHAANYAVSRAFRRGRDDVDGYVYVTKLLIQRALDLAEQSPQKAVEFRSAAVPMMYNLAANTWPGWGDGEVAEVSESHRRLGLEAARRNVELAQDLDFPPARRRNGYWILGAHLIAAEDYAAARRAFAASAEFARQAGIETGALMADGWRHAATILEHEGAADGDKALAAEARRKLAGIQDRLRSIDADGAFYADQYRVALEVFAVP